MEENSNFEHSLDERLLIMLVVILVLACVVGTLGNIIILTVVRIYKPLKMAERVFIFNLAVSDLYVTVIADPLSIVGKYLTLFIRRQKSRLDQAHSICRRQIKCVPVFNMV